MDELELPWLTVQLAADAVAWIEYFGSGEVPLPSSPEQSLLVVTTEPPVAAIQTIDLLPHRLHEHLQSSQLEMEEDEFFLVLQVPPGTFVEGESSALDGRMHSLTFSRETFREIVALCKQGIEEEHGAQSIGAPLEGDVPDSFEDLEQMWDDGEKEE